MISRLICIGDNVKFQKYLFHFHCFLPFEDIRRCLQLLFHCRDCTLARSRCNSVQLVSIQNVAYITEFL